MAKQDKDSLGRFTRADGTPAPPPDPDAPKRRRRPSAFKHFRVDAVLTDPAERAEYERLLADPNSTADTLKAWLTARGHAVCKNAVRRHRKAFAAAAQQLKECARVADALCALTRKHGAGTMAEASHAMFEMKLMQGLFNASSPKPDAQGAGTPHLPVEQWQSLAKTLSSVVATRRSVEAMRDDFDRRAKEAAAAAADAARQRATPKEIAERVRDILGA